MTTHVIIVAAGRGNRAGGDVAKQWQMLAGQPVLAHTLAAFAGLPVLLVIHPDDMARASNLGVPFVTGGATRDASVLAGLQALEGTGATRVLIHDGARPLVSRALIDRLFAALDSHAGAAPALAVTDALWRGDAGLVTGSIDRTGLFGHKRRRPSALRRFWRLTLRMAAARPTMWRWRGRRGLTWPSSRATIPT